METFDDVFSPIHSNDSSSFLSTSGKSISSTSNLSSDVFNVPEKPSCMPPESPCKSKTGAKFKNSVSKEMNKVCLKEKSSDKFKSTTSSKNIKQQELKEQQITVFPNSSRRKSVSRPSSLELEVIEKHKLSEKEEAIHNVSNVKNKFNKKPKVKSDKTAEKPRSSNSSQKSKNSNISEKLLDFNKDNSVCKSQSETGYGKTLNNLLHCERRTSDVSLKASIERMVHNCISFECDKIRQNLYMQRIWFVRQHNKLQEDSSKQFFNTRENLCNIIEELVAIDSMLKTKSSSE